jgi:AraC-like DNA-binding protein
VLQIRAVTLTSYLPVAELLDLEPFAMLRDADLAPAWLEDPEYRIPAMPVIQLLEASAQRSGCESFGIRMAEHRSFASLGPLALLLEHLDTVHDDVEALMVYRRHLNDVVDIEIERFGDTSIIRFDFIPEFSSVQGIDLSLGVGLLALTGASGGRWQPSAVHLMRRSPENPRPWRQLFRSPIEFDSGFNGFSCSTASLSVENPRADPTMAQHARRLLDLVPINPQDAPARERTSRVITLLLPKGMATAEQVAGNIGISLRGLQRSLEQEGTTFGTLLNEVRRLLAQHYLTQSTQSITAIAESTGYSTLSSFTRWFTCEFGLTPRAWRMARRQQGNA